MSGRTSVFPLICLAVFAAATVWIAHDIRKMKSGGSAMRPRTAMGWVCTVIAGYAAALLAILVACRLLLAHLGRLIDKAEGWLPEKPGQKRSSLS